MKLFFRADASQKMCTGHLMRCFSLAHRWQQNGGEAFFITKPFDQIAPALIEREGFTFACLDLAGDDLPATLALLKQHSARCLVLDGYHFDWQYQREVTAAGVKLLVIDDLAAEPHYYADIILNQNYGGPQQNYLTEPTTKLLLGTRYAILRSEFLEYRSLQRTMPAQARRVLLTMGGGDPDNMTRHLLAALSLIVAPLEIKVVLGTSNLNGKTVAAVATTSHHQVEILKDVRRMATLMAWADIAVSACGGTTWEILSTGLPVILCVLADNQAPTATALKGEGFAVLGWPNRLTTAEISDIIAPLLSDKSRREAMGISGKELIDGQGSQRVTEALKTFFRS